MNLTDHFKKQLLADTALIARTQNHDFVALTAQSRAISARFAQKLEKAAVENILNAKEFDPSANSFLLQKDRIASDNIAVDEARLLDLLSKK